MERLGQRGAPILALSILAGLLSSFFPAVAIADEPVIDTPTEEVPQTPILGPEIELGTESPSTFVASTVPAATVNYFIFENFLQRYGGEYGDTYQTALKVGDDRFDPTLYITAEGGAPTVVVDLSELGISDPVSLFVDGPLNSVEYYAYLSRTRPVVGAGVPDGLKTITATVTNAEGTVTTATYSIQVDSTAPTMTVTSVERTDGNLLAGGSTLLLSGTIDGTGTGIRLYEIHQNEYGTDGTVVRSFQIQGLAGVEEMFGLGAGEFTEVPLVVQSQAGDGLLHPETTSLTYSFLAIDEAGNQVLAETPRIPLQGEITPPTPTVSNVLFLPGIKGSRLYGDDGNKLWIPGGDNDVRELFLNVLGKSERNDIHVRRNDILTQVEIPLAPIRIYQSFVDKMNTLQTAGMMAEWEAVPYDWRLSLPDIINNGVERGGNIYYTEPTDAPYIEQTLRRLAASSKTGKVTIVAHSNGGLVAKALMQKLGDVETAALVDEVVFVGVPQSGAPQAIGALLYGYDEDLPFPQLPVLASASVSRALAENTPMAYHLLPTSSYFSTSPEQEDVIRFNGSKAYKEEVASYGASIDSWVELRDFMRATEGGRSKPAEKDLHSANIANASLLSYAEETHNSIDSWLPPAGIEVHQIAGWGVKTLVGLELREFSLPWFGVVQEDYLPVFGHAGDRTVTTSSATYINVSPQVKDYWINLVGVAQETSKQYSHKDLLEIASVLNLITSIVQEEGEITATGVISTSEPIHTDTSNWLRFFLHSPLTLEVIDTDGNRVGLNEDGSSDTEIHGSEYNTFGGVHYITVPADGDYQVILDGYDEGLFSLDIQELKGEEVQDQVTFAGIPSSSETTARLKISDGLSEETSLMVDMNGDGQYETELAAQINEQVLYTPHDEAVEDTDVSSSNGSKEVSETPSVYEEPLPKLPDGSIEIQLSPASEPVILTKDLQGEVLGALDESIDPSAEALSANEASTQNWFKALLAWVYNSFIKVFSGISDFFTTLYAY